MAVDLKATSASWGHVPLNPLDPPLSKSFRYGRDFIPYCISKKS